MNETKLGLPRNDAARQSFEKGIEIAEGGGKLSWSLLFVKFQLTTPIGCYVVRPYDGIPDRNFGLANESHGIPV
jgi:hypothetical protein